MPPSELILTMRPPPDLPHQARALLAAEEDRLQVHGVDEVPVALGDLERIEAGEAGGVVDQAVEASEVRCRLRRTGARFPRRFPGWRGTPARCRTLRRCAALPFGTVVMDGHARAFRGQAQRDAAADAPGGAGNQHDLDLSSAVVLHAFRSPPAPRPGAPARAAGRSNAPSPRISRWWS